MEVTPKSFWRHSYVGNLKSKDSEMLEVEGASGVDSVRAILCETVCR